MVNRHRGEIAAELDGKNYTLCLTLGALAELEQAFGDQDMLALVERFERGRLSAGDVQKIICTALRGGGHAVTEEDVATMKTKGGAAGFVEIVSDLLRVTFANDTTADNETRAPRPEQDREVSQATSPFPGNT